MARAFIRLGDSFNVGLDQPEREVIAQLAQEVGALVRADLGISGDAGPVAEAAGSEDPLTRLEAEFASGTDAQTPRDPAVQRLFPWGTEPGSERAREFRRLAQPGMADERLSRLDLLRATVAAPGDTAVSLTLDRRTAEQWAIALNDLRLVLADRIGIRTADDFETLQLLRRADLPDPDAEAAEEAGTATVDYMATLYEFLSWLQDSLVSAMSNS